MDDDTDALQELAYQLELEHQRYCEVVKEFEQIENQLESNYEC